MSLESENSHIDKSQENSKATISDITNRKIVSLLNNGYKSLLSQLDNMQISPNRLVTLRTGVSLGVAGILTTQDNLGTGTELILLTIGALSLIADRVDGDLARYTDQCSLEGEVLDAGADKVVVYGALAMIIAQMGGEVNPYIENTLLAGTLTAGILDIISQGFRGLDNNITALKAAWSKPLNKEERAENARRPKSQNAANIYGKIKTGAVMTAVALGVQDILPLEDDTKYSISAGLVGVSLVLSALSLLKKVNSLKSSS